ncbi:MAG: DNA polymerase III subunit gamma/tau [Gammaproteobacteria bacterium]
MTNEPFLPLARKWRPQTFSELAGQEYAVRVLQNAARQDRLHHAFLFTGTRGVGKTSLARIVAKMANCRSPEDGAPCLKCGFCEQIAAGRFLDVAELDAASHTQVEKMRELLESAKYPPSQGRCKVFIIDEAHMLSKSAFAAMLKTLEEPPPYLKFILATTDPQKLPATIMSRCLCFALRPLERSQIAAQLEKILHAEKRKYAAPAVQIIARLARGSMRDALSILEQALAHGGESLEADAVRRITGETDSSLVVDVLRAVSKTDAAAIAGFARRMSEEGAGFDSALSRLAALLYKTALAKVAPAEAAADEEEAALIQSIAPLFSDEQLQLLYEIAVRGRQQLPWAPDEQTGFEMTLLRMTLFAPIPAEEISAPTRPAARAPSAKTGENAAAEAAKVSADGEEFPPDMPPPPPIPEDEAPAEKAVSPSARWREAMSRMSNTALALARSCTLEKLGENEAVLRVDKSQKSGANLMLPELRAQLREIFHDKFEVELRGGEDDSAADARAQKRTEEAKKQPFVRDMLATMPEARLVENGGTAQDGETQ